VINLLRKHVDRYTPEMVSRVCGTPQDKFCRADTGHRLPTQSTDGRSTCFCGAGLTIGGMADHVRSAHVEMAR
jgi:anaerobic selenocysteine-containing dehydrogenase